MTANRLASKLRRGETAIGGWCSLSDSLAAEMVAQLNVDYVAVDMQHGTAAYGDLVAMLQGIGNTQATPIVRISYGNLGLAQRVLDAGAQGIIVPLVDSPADAEAAAQACRYPPKGRRSFGPIRAKMYFGSDPEVVNDEVLCLVQIETPGAMENLDAIVNTPGIDGVYVGPADLALAFGLPIGREHPEMEKMISSIADACHGAAVIAGIHAFSGDAAHRAAERGYSMITVGSDATWLRAGYSKEVAIARGESPDDTVGFY